MLQRLTSTLCFLFLLLHLHAQDTKPLVVATASIFSDMAEAIGGSFVEVKSIVPIGGDPHMYEPTPGDAVLASKADLILRNGLTFEGWLNELIENSGTAANLVLITDGIEPITSAVYKNAPDPHAWMDAENGLIYIENIKRALIELVPEREKEIEFNYQAYKSDLLQLHAYIQKQVDRIPPKQRILITSHDAFQYYGRKYGLRLESVLGTSTDAQAQTSDIVRLDKVIKSSGVPAVFIETTVNPKLLEQIAKDNHVRIGGKLYSDSLGDEDSPAPTYIDMLKYNTETIVKALSIKTDSTANEMVQTNNMSRLLYFIPILLIIIFLALYLIKKKNKS